MINTYRTPWREERGERGGLWGGRGGETGPGQDGRGKKKRENTEEEEHEGFVLQAPKEVQLNARLLIDSNATRVFPLCYSELATCHWWSLIRCGFVIMMFLRFLLERLSLSSTTDASNGRRPFSHRTISFSSSARGIKTTTGRCRPPEDCLVLLWKCIF